MEPQEVMLIPVDKFNQMLEDQKILQSKLEVIYRHIMHDDNPNDPLKAEGYYYGDEIRELLGWSKSTWTNGKKSHMIVDGEMILERDPQNQRRYRCKRKDLHRFIQINNTARYNQLFNIADK